MNFKFDYSFTIIVCMVMGLSRTFFDWFLNFLKIPNRYLFFLHILNKLFANSLTIGKINFYCRSWIMNFVEAP